MACKRTYPLTTECPPTLSAEDQCICWANKYTNYYCIESEWQEVEGGNTAPIQLTCMGQGNEDPLEFHSLNSFCSFCYKHYNDGTWARDPVSKWTDNENYYVRKFLLKNISSFAPDNSTSGLGVLYLWQINLYNDTTNLTSLNTINLESKFQYYPLSDYTKCPDPIHDTTKSLCFSGKHITTLKLIAPNQFGCVSSKNKWICTIKNEDYTAIGESGSTIIWITTISTLILINYSKFATNITGTGIEELQFFSDTKGKDLDTLDLSSPPVTLNTLTLEKIPSKISGSLEQMSTISFESPFITITSLDGSLANFSGLTTLNLPSTLNSFAAYLPTNDPKQILDFLPSADKIETIDLTGVKFAQLKSSDFSTLKILNKLILPSDTTEDNLKSLALPESLKTLNLAKTTKITNISFDTSNSITILTLPSDSSKLISIDLSKTQVKLEQLNGTKLTSLGTLIAGKNTDDDDLSKFTPIPSLSKFNLASTSITKCPKDLSLIKDLTTLTLTDKIISYSATLSATVVKLILPSSLHTIDLSGTITSQLSSTDFSGYASLQRLTLGSSETTFNITPPKNSENFTTLSLQKTAINPFGPNLANVTDLTTLDLPAKLLSYSATLNSAFKNLPLPTTLTTIDLSGTAIAQLKNGGDFSSFATLDSLALGPDVTTLKH